MRYSVIARAPWVAGLALLLTVIALVATAVFLHVAPAHSADGVTHANVLAEPGVTADGHSHQGDESLADSHEHAEIDHDSTMRLRAPDLTGSDIAMLPVEGVEQYVASFTDESLTATVAVTAAEPSLIALSINRT